MNKEKRILILIIVLIGLVATLAFTQSKSTDTVKSEEEVMKEYIEKAKEIKVHCDYCGGYVFNKYTLDANIPNILMFQYTNKNGKLITRFICEHCIIKTNLKTFDKMLGRPKYIKDRPERYKEEAK